MIDEMESIGVPGNLRVPISVEPIRGGRACRAIAYMKSRELAVPVHTPYLAEYHDRRFVPPDRRAKGPLAALHSRGKESKPLPQPLSTAAPIATREISPYKWGASGRRQGETRPRLWARRPL